jgi:serine/threonine protein kinase
MNLAGLVLLESASGKYPYPEASAQIVLVMNLTEGDPPLPPRDGRYSAAFHDVLERMIAKDPSARASAVDLLDSEWYTLRFTTRLRCYIRVIVQVCVPQNRFTGGGRRCNS